MADDTRHGRVLFCPPVAVGFGLMPDQQGPTGPQIKRARKALHMRQSDVAEQMGVDLRTFGRWERGETAVPDHRVGELVQLLRIPTVTDRPEQTGQEFDDDTIAAALRQASHLQVLAELARRIQAAQEPDRELPPIPQVHLQWPMHAEPSQKSPDPVDDVRDRRTDGDR